MIFPTTKQIEGWTREWLDSSGPNMSHDEFVCRRAYREGVLAAAQECEPISPDCAAMLRAKVGVGARP